MADKTSVSDGSDLQTNGVKADTAQHARAETMMNSGPAKVALLDSKVWGDVSIADATPADPGAQTKVPGKDGTQAGKAAEQCPGNADYQAIMERTARNIYNPADLGDLSKIMSKGCIANTKDAIALADDAVKAANDPYTDVLPPSEANNLRIALQGHLIGVGVQIGRPESAPGKAPVENGPILIQTVFRNSPAENGGLKKGDLITSVNGTDVSKMTPEDVAQKLLRGKEGEDVKVSVLRDGKPQEFQMKRADYIMPAVEDQKIGDFAYIKFEDMGNETAADQLKAALEKHQDAKGFILDLRDNPGGLVPNALLAASLIMEKGEVMKVRARIEGDPNKPEYDVQRYLITPTGVQATGEDVKDKLGDEDVRMPDLVHKPLIVLTNENTGSAAEILAGALKDNHEATLVGTKTFGKGIGQNVYDDMPGGSILKVTNFRFFTPSGAWIGDGHDHRIGIEPHKKVENQPDVQLGSAQDSQLNEAIKLLKEKTGAVK